MRILMLCMLVLSCFFVGCKKSPDTSVAVVMERLEITPANVSLLIGEGKQMSVIFYNQVGQAAPVPAGTTWSSLNPTIFSVSSTGVVQGISAGQGRVQVTYQNISTTALVNVLANNQQLAIILLSPQDVQLTLNQTAPMSASGENLSGAVIPGLIFTWQSSNDALVSVNSSGVVTGKAYGTAQVSASSMGLQSAPVMVQVVRTGSFSGSGSSGTAMISISNNILRLTTSANFVASTGAPDLRMYLTNNPNSVVGAIEVATLNQRNGAQSWNISPPTTITQFRYALIWCKQFGGNYGAADLGM